MVAEATGDSNIVGDFLDGPKTYSQAMNIPAKKKWREAMDRELAALHKNNNANGTVAKLKARLAGGDRQQEFID